jgi:hypothetical protein
VGLGDFEFWGGGGVGCSSGGGSCGFGGVSCSVVG